MFGSSQFRVRLRWVLRDFIWSGGHDSLVGKASFPCQLASWLINHALSVLIVFQSSTQKCE